MSTFFLISILIGAMAGLVTAMIVLLVLQVRNSTQVNKLTFPAYEYVVKQAENKANEIVGQAQKEARSIIANAEETGQKTIQEYTVSATDAHNTYIDTVNGFTKSLTAQLSDATKVSAEQIAILTAEATASLHSEKESISSQLALTLQAVEKISARMESQTNVAVTHMKEQIAQVSEALIKKIETESEQNQEYIDTYLAKALDVAEAQIDGYKESRVSLLDAHIERLVEDITSRVLHKRLSLKDHAELAREALAEAKEQNIL
jgi:F0F1-type ATP synthase membrane subunit b/b'